MMKTIFRNLFLFAFCLVSTGVFAQSQAAQGTSTVLYTGQAASTLEPCGCKGDNLGGIDVRAKEIDAIRKEGTPTLLLESGGAFASGTIYDKMRTEFYLEVLDKMGYDALSVGKNDITLGPAFFETVAKDRKFPFLSSNLRIGAQNPTWSKPYLMKTLGTLKVGVFGLLPALPKPEGVDNVFWASDPVKAASDTVKTLLDSEKANCVILLSDLPTDVEDAVAQSVPGIDLLISNNPGTAFGKIANSNTVKLATYLQARKLGRLDMAIDPQTTRLGYKPSEIPILRKAGETSEMLDFLNQFYAKLLADPKLTEKAVKPMMDLPLEKDGKAQYAGPDACKACHPEANRSWLSSQHYQSYRRLQKDQKYYVPECIGCHVTGYGHPAGYTKIDANSPQARVTCESCHGPGSLHVANPKESKLRVDGSEAFCARCHTGKYAPNFHEKYKSYYDSYFPHVKKK